MNVVVRKPKRKARPETDGATVAALREVASVRPWLVAAVSLTKTFSGILSLGATEAEFSVPGVLAGDMILIVPTAAMPDGWMIGAAYSVEEGKVRVPFYGPLLSLGQSASFSFKVVATRIG